MSRRGVLLLAAGLFLPAASRAQVVPDPVQLPDPPPMEERAPMVAENHGQLVLSGPVNPATYRLGPGDLLSIQLWGRVSRLIPLEVGPEGTVALPVGGLLRVGGLTLEEARRQILERLRREYRDVRVGVELRRPRRFRLLLVGDVVTPGFVEVQGSMRVGDLVSSAKLKPTASMRNIEVVHSDGTRERADMGRLLRIGDGSRDPMLRDGDVVHVPIATEWVEVVGAVASSGRLERAPDDSLKTLLRLAGGPLPSASEDVLWMHWGTAARVDSIRLKLADVLDGGGSLSVSNGDRLYVYYFPNFREQQQVRVVGEVARPGSYPIHEGSTRISEIISACGGFLQNADLSAIRIQRSHDRLEAKDPELDRLLRLSRGELTSTEYEVLRTKLAEHREEYRLDWNNLGRDPGALDVPLRDGDIVQVDRLVSTIRVDGEVQRPAILAYRPRTSWTEYVAQAGGFTSRAWRGKVRITRAVSGQTLLARNVRTLDPGDFVWVPEKPDITAWQQGKEVLGALAQIATIVIAIRSVR